MRWFYCFLLFGLLFTGLLSGAAHAQSKTFTNSFDMEFVLIPAGKFITILGSNEFDEAITRVVTISKPFYLGKYEVTQAQWTAVTGNNPSYHQGWKQPVERVSWFEVINFIRELNRKEGGGKYRLPTEAEWEHAARAGTGTKWFFGNDSAALGEYAWFEDNSSKTTHPVGEKKPNPWGLYDIYGNVWEWVMDTYEEYQPGEVTDPTGAEHGSYKVYRGGSGMFEAERCRSAYREWNPPEEHGRGLGFRLAFSPGQ